MHAVTGETMHAVTGETMHAVTGETMHAVTGETTRGATGETMHAATGETMHAADLIQNTASKTKPRLNGSAACRNAARNSGGRVAPGGLHAAGCGQ
jgi:hypothetical protein